MKMLARQNLKEIVNEVNISKVKVNHMQLS